MQYQYPFPLDTITTVFGQVDDEHPNGHRGTDFAPGGLPIPAVSDGVVVRDEFQTGLGNVITVRADDGIFWACCHMASRSSFNVGDRVARGDTVGVVGNTGSLTTGRHLHFTMSPSSDNPAFGVVFDCIPYITARLSSTAGGGSTPFTSTQEDETPMFLMAISDGKGTYGAKGTKYRGLFGPNYFLPIFTDDTFNKLSVRFGNAAAANGTYEEWEAALVASGLTVTKWKTLIK